MLEALGTEWWTRTQPACADGGEDEGGRRHERIWRRGCAGDGDDPVLLLPHVLVARMVLI